MATINYVPPGPQALAFHQSNAFVRGLMGPVGCLPGDSEFLTPRGWKRMDAYEPGDEVAVWQDGRVFFEAAEWVSGRAHNDFYRFDSGSLVMDLSPAHRVLHWDWAGRQSVATAEEVAQRPGKRTIPTTFQLERADADISDAELRLRVMVAADGHLPGGGPRIQVSVRKQRKIDRVEQLLRAAGVRFSEACYSRIEGVERRFTFELPGLTKGLDFVWGLSTRQLQIVLEEAMHWDGLHASPEKRFHTTVLAEAEAIQFAAHATGLRASIRTYQDRRSAAWKPMHVVQIRAGDNRRNRAMVRGDTTRISRFYPEDGRQYCFTTSTGFFVARCQGTVFVTGNSGKSSSSCMEIFARATAQKPSPDGVRRSRWAAIRNTYGELKTTTIKTWSDWFRDVQVMRWDAPIVSMIDIPLPDGTRLELEVLFLALDKPDDVGKLRSLELTGAWLNEASELEKAVLDMCTQRVGRYPSMRVGGPSWTGVIMDTNPVDDDHWYYHLAEEERPEGFEFFRQPGGLYKVLDRRSPDYGKLKPNPLAENIRNLQGGHQYYLQQLAGKSDDYVRVFLLGDYGTTLTGKPVYPEWQDRLHIATQTLSPTPGLPLILGFDFGLTPACIIGQQQIDGQLRILKELTSESMGIREFYSDVVLPVLNSEYRHFRLEAVGDPAGVNRSQTDAKTCFEELAMLGLTCEPADSNEFVKRRESVAFFLQRINSRGPGFLIDPDCRTVIKGFRGGYRYERVKASGSARFKDRPAKDKFSHPHDALQYLCMHARGDAGQAITAPVIQSVAWA